MQDFEYPPRGLGLQGLKGSLEIRLTKVNSRGSGLRVLGEACQNYGLALDTLSIAPPSQQLILSTLPQILITVNHISSQLESLLLPC